MYSQRSTFYFKSILTNTRTTFSLNRLSGLFIDSPYLQEVQRTLSWQYSRHYWKCNFYSTNDSITADSILMVTMILTMSAILTLRTIKLMYFTKAMTILFTIKSSPMQKETECVVNFTLLLHEYLKFL